MSEMMAYCGLLCSECPAYKATVADDMALRKETAENWSKMFGADIKTEDINCLGCESDTLFGHCKICEIRACAKEKAVEDCGRCDSFACAKVEGILKHDGAARERLSRK
jgi:hypothetical protein